jgi:hypothetical protein
MTNATLVKFPETSDLTGYGFDIGADRVVRFNKHADGTYQNTRATYSINKKQFTHYDLRKAALELKSEVSTKIKQGSMNIKWKWVIGVMALVFILSASECSFNVNSEFNVSQEQSDSN